MSEKLAGTLNGKTAVIYGASGSIGGAVARKFAAEGAVVFLAGRTKATLDKVADEIRSSGGSADTCIVDAHHEEAVESFLDNVISKTGRVDISFNLISTDDVQKPLHEITVEEFLHPIINLTRSQFITSRAAARLMSSHGNGVILLFGGGGPQTLPGLGGFKVSLDAQESLRRQFSCEFGPSGVRVITLKTGGIPETIPDDFASKETVEQSIIEATLLKRAATLDDVSSVAAFLASDQARSITATEVNISAGSMVD